MTTRCSQRSLSPCFLIVGSAAALACSVPAEAAGLGDAVDPGVPGAAAPTATQPAPDLSNDIIVTATRRDEKLHDVPISASVLSSATVQSLTSGGLDMRALAFTVPSLNVETTQGRNFPRFYIRGYGNTDYGPFASQPVGLVLDDVVQENPNLKGFPIFDLADVQVYRGPQGTLFGRNAPAGVVSVRSAAPRLDSFGGYLSVADGTFDTGTVEGVINAPLNSVLAARVSVQYQRRDNWVHDPITGQTQDGWKDTGIRAQLLYDPSTSFTALFNVHARILNGGETLWRANAIKPGADEPSQYASFREIYTDRPFVQSSRTIGGSIRLKWNVGDLTVQSISAWEKILSTYSAGDIDGGYGASYAPPSGPGLIPFAVDTASGLPNLDQLTQEVRVASDPAGRLRWIAGLYYYYEDTDYYANDLDGLTGIPTDHEVSRQVNNAAAVFGSATLDVTSRIQLRGGLRYTYDHKTFNISDLVNLSYEPLKATETAQNLSWDASAAYKLSHDISAYVRAATGFRAPSFGAPTAVNGLEVAKQETDTSFEGGLKTFLFDRALRADVSIYYFRIHDQQLTAVGGSSNAALLLNARRTIAYGAEGEFQATIAKSLDLNLSGSYNFTKLEDPTLSVSVCASCMVTNPINAQGNAIIDGNPLPQAPRYTAAAGLDYHIPISAETGFFFRPDISYRGGYNFFLYESMEFRSEPFLNLGLRAGLRLDGDKYEAAVFCRNCANKLRLLEGIDFDNLTAVLNDPRIIGAQLTAHF